MSKAVSRRTAILGAVAVVAVGAAVVEGPKLLRLRRAPGPYGDLLSLLDDRDACAQVGEAALAGKPGFDLAKVAADLRNRLNGKDLADVAVAEAEAGRVVETGGWVMPDCLALLCALAAKAG